MVKLNNLKCCHKCHVVVCYVRKAEGDCNPPGIPVERFQGVWQLLWRRLQYWDRSGFSMRGECMWLRVGSILCRTGSLDTLKVWMHVLVTANICLCGKNRFSRSVLRTHPSCLLQDWISFPKSNDSLWDLHSRECQSHRMRNRISCCSFIIKASICAYEKWTSEVSLVILASLFIKILIGCSDWLNHFPWFSVGVIDCYWWYPLRPKLISVSLSVSLNSCCLQWTSGDKYFLWEASWRSFCSFSRSLCLWHSLYSRLWIKCQISAYFDAVVWMRFRTSLEVIELMICITVIHESVIRTNPSCFHILMGIISIIFNKNTCRPG